MNFKKVYSSILDYKQDKLCPAIWNTNNILRDNVRDFIYLQIIDFFERRDINKYQHFLESGYIGSSLATYYYTDESDLDIKFLVNISEFKKYNESFASWTTEGILWYLIDTGRKSKELTSTIPNTGHVLDVYFYDSFELPEEHLLRFDSLYSIGSNSWIKEPKPLPKELPPNYFLEKAKEYAEPYLAKISEDFNKTKIDSKDFMFLRNYLKSLHYEDMSEIQDYYYDLLYQIDKDLDNLIDDRKLLMRMRREGFSKEELKTEIEKLGGSLNYSQGNLIYKLLQRYGYLKILREISKIKEKEKLNEQDIPIILSLIP